MLNFNMSSLVGKNYYCAPQNYTSLGFGFGFSKRSDDSSATYQPEQNGTITHEGVAVAQEIYRGLHNSNGERGYLSWQIGSELSDGVPIMIHKRIFGKSTFHLLEANILLSLYNYWTSITFYRWIM